MKAKFARLRSRFMLLIVIMGLVVGGQTWAQTATIDSEKARLVSKLAKYVGWPAQAMQAKFIIGVYDDVEKYEYFSNYFANKGVKGKDISVRLVESFSQAKEVNILYISSPNQRKVLQIIDRVISGSNVLIVTEDTKDLSTTMIDISYDEEQSKIDFKVIDSNIVKAQLTLAELSYFFEDNNSEEILSPSPTFAKKNQQDKQYSALENKLALQQSALNQLNNKLNSSKENLEKYNLALQKNAERLEIEQQENTQKSQEIKAKDKQLQDLEKKLKAQQRASRQSGQISVEGLTAEQILEEEEKAQAEIQAQEKFVADLTEELKKQKDIANNASIKLTNVTKDNESLSSFQTLFYVFVLIAVIALLIAFMMWNKAKNVASKPSLPSKNENKSLLPIREDQLIKSENFAALGYIATDITYAAGLSLNDMQAKLESAGDTKNATTLKPVVTLLENFNIIAADQDDTDIQSFNVIAYVQKMIMLYEFEFSQSDIVYNYSGEKDLTIKSVPSYIALVLLNIINNSLKHGFDNNGNGKIALKVEKGAKGGAKITYSDDGKGMNKATLEQIFKPFFTTRSDRGYVGVGMSTTYDLIKNKLSGDIKIDSKEGKGTTVTITLP
tara:strand:+ start:15142 stop:16980 length:1839 start_codon:yes stop_codon:yes gene_type:complete